MSNETLSQAIDIFLSKKKECPIICANGIH